MSESKYSKTMKLNVYFLEPDLFHKHTTEILALNGSRIGEDFLILHNLLKRYNFTSCTFVGPDSANVDDTAGIDLFTE